MLAPAHMASSTGLYTRRVVLGLSAALGLVGLYWIGRSFVVDGQLRFGNPVDRALPRDADVLMPVPLAVRAEVTRVTGNPVVRAGDKCEFLVQRLVQRGGAMQCNAQVVCGDKLLYGGPDRGFFPCRLFEGERNEILGSDASTTRVDQDGAIHLDTRTGVLRVWDDASSALGEFQVEADVLSVQ